MSVYTFQFNFSVSLICFFRLFSSLCQKLLCGTHPQLGLGFIKREEEQCRLFSFFIVMYVIFIHCMFRVIVMLQTEFGADQTPP